MKLSRAVVAVLFAFAVVLAGAEIHEMRPAERSLEEAFLEMTI